MKTLVEKAESMSYHAHKGQKYKQYDYFIYHILGVLTTIENNASEEEIIVTLLHDVVEDTEVTLEEIENEFGRSIKESVDAITKREGEKYDHYIRRVTEDWAACKVKLYDSHFNLTECLKDGDIERAKKYINVLNTLVGG